GRHPGRGADAGRRMSTLTGDAALGPRSDLLTARVRGRRRAVDLLVTGLLGLSFLAAVVPLAFVIYLVVSKGAGALSGDFLTADIPRQFRTSGGGMGPAVAGTIVITAAAALMAIPLGVLGAVYLNEFGGKGVLAKLIRFLSDVMA